MKKVEPIFLIDQLINSMDTPGTILLTAGSAFVGESMVLLNSHVYLWAVVCVVVGVGLYIARDFVKE